jgi:hypothetical protein
MSKKKGKKKGGVTLQKISRFFAEGTMAPVTAEPVSSAFSPARQSTGYVTGITLLLPLQCSFGW